MIIQKIIFYKFLCLRRFENMSDCDSLRLVLHNICDKITENFLFNLVPTSLPSYVLKAF